MRAYLAVGKLRFMTGLQYRTAAFAGLLTQFFFGSIFIMVYIAFYRNTGAQPPMTLQEVVTYIWLQQMFLSLISLYSRDPDIFQLITGGNIAYELCRPCGLYGFWYAKLLATRVSNVVLRCFPILLVTPFLPAPYGMSPPPDLETFLLFLLSLLLGLLVVCAITLLTYISIFWTMSPVGSTLMVAMAGEFLAGMILPIPMMPVWMQNIANAFPFRWAVDFPFRLYTGNIPAEAAWGGILVQLVWIFLLIGLGLLLIRRALRQVVVQGGYRKMRLYWKYLSILFRSQMQYRTSFLLLTIGQFFIPFSVFAGLYFLFSRFGQLEGWSFFETALCFGVIHMAFSVTECFVRGFDVFSSLIVNGDFDRLLVRPRGTVVQVLGSNFEFTRFGRMLQSAFVLGWALWNLPIVWTPLKVLTLLMMMAGGVLIFSGIFILNATMCFWTVQGLEVGNLLTDGGREMAQYPLNIYQKRVTVFFTFIIPFGCVSYLPLLFLLDRTDGPALLYALLPLASVLFLLPCLAVWQVGIRHYRSTGS